MSDFKTNIRLASDLHLEFYLEQVRSGKVLPSDLAERIISSDIKDLNTHLVLAGDIVLLKYLNDFLPFFQNLSNRFKNVIWIFGNHEWFSNKIKKERFDEVEQILSIFKNIHVLENKSIELNEYLFLGTTMWSDINHGDYITALDVVAVSKDYKKIDFKEGQRYSKLRPRHVSMMFKNAQEFINSTLKAYKDSKLIKVVITHHPPMREAVPEEYQANPDFWSDFGDFDFKYLQENKIEPEFWLHGHIHKSQKFKIGNVSILSNPYGYDDVHLEVKKDLNKNYKKLFIK